MPRRTRADSEATAESLLETATRLFADRGYAAVRLEDVASAAGVTRGAVYHHFGTKQGLFEAVLGRVQAAVGEAVAAAADDAVAVAGPWAGFEAGCRTFLTASLADDARRIMLVDAPAVLGWAVWRAQDADASSRHLHEALTSLQADDLVDVASVPAAAALLSGAMNEAALWIADEDSPAALDDAWVMLSRLLVALRPAPR